MSRGGSYGGGQSSLGYLFGSEEQPREPPPSQKVILPPYGVDEDDDANSATTTTLDKLKRNNNNPSSEKKIISPSNNYPRVQGQNSGNFITDRPSTKVKSVPGGDSSLGYLFGDK